MNRVMGGLERQIMEISEILESNKCKVSIITFDEGDVAPFFGSEYRNLKIYPINIGSPDIPANLRTKFLRQIAVLKLLKQIKPDLGIAFMYGGFLMSRAAMLLIRKPLVLAERNSPAMYQITSVRRYRYLIFITMFFTKRITVQFDVYKGKYPRFLRRKISTVPNTILEIKEPRKPRINGEVRFVFAGRFSFQKGALELIRAFALFQEKYPKAILNMYGEGEQRTQIERQIVLSNLEEKVFLRGADKIEAILSGSDVLCFPSIWEGFPNTLAESLKYGVPAIGYADCDGVSSLIIDNFNGWLGDHSKEERSLSILLERAYIGTVNQEIKKENIISSVSKYNRQEISKIWESIVLTDSKAKSSRIQGNRGKLV
jgi:glycosyltransferase involved in cell wall biosynthesis